MKLGVSDEILVPLLSRAWRARTQTWSLQKKNRSFGWNLGPAFLHSMKGEDPGFLNLWNLEFILRNLKFRLKLTRLYYPSLSWFKIFLFKTGFQTSQVKWSPRVLFAKPEVFTVVKTCVTAMAIKYSLKAWTFSYTLILLKNRTFYDFSKFSHHEVYNSEFLLPGDIYNLCYETWPGCVNHNPMLLDRGTMNVKNRCKLRHKLKIVKVYIHYSMEICLNIFLTVSLMKHIVK